jgi:isoleucyl-tRNA synthetase
MAISVNDAFEYSVVKHGDKHLLVARKRVEDLEKEFKSPLAPIDTVSGDNLVGMVCSHPIFGRDSPVLAGSHVTLESGTGLVHTAPGHGREDWLVCKPFNIPVLCPVNDDGVFTREAGPQFEGKDIFKDGNRLVIEELQNRNVLLKKEDYTHRYPYDWRTKKPVIWRATKQWFTDLTHIKDTAIEEVNNVQLVPPSGRARLSAMLKTRDDWCISRQRHWGVPIPVFYDIETDEHLMNDETIEFIQELIRKHGTNCWWTMSTEDLLPPKYRNNGRKYRKGTDTMDVWFDSGCSWASVLTDVYKKGDSLKDEEAVLNDIVADIYLEGSDQHRGWFQSSLLTSVAVRDKAPFKTIVTHGFTLDEHGRKMSKSLGNVIEPSQVIEGGNDKKKNPAYGVDVLRFWVSSTDYSNDVTISESLLEATSSNLKKLRNTCRFLLGNLNEFSAKDELPYDQLSSVDKYMLHRLTQFAQSIDQAYEAFNFSQVYKELTQFATGDLSSFYFEISKDKLYTMSKKSQHRKSCQTVLLKILDTLSKAMAPILCHTAEDIFQHSPILQEIKKQGTESIHAQGWFNLAPEWNNPELDTQWLALKELKSNVNKILEHARQNEEKSHVHTALDASVKIKLKADSSLYQAINSVGEHLNEVFVVSGTTVEVTDNLKAQGEFSIVVEDAFGHYVITIEKSTNHKCPRCWKRTSTEAEKLCLPCDNTVKEL